MGRYDLQVDDVVEELGRYRYGEIWGDMTCRLMTSSRSWNASPRARK